jgi:predicted amidohydrolase YtcJ
MSRPAALMVVHARPLGLERADTLAVLEGRVVTGTESELSACRGPATRVIDAHGATVTPGITDAHIHLVSWARSRAELTLSPGWSRTRVVEAVRGFAAGEPDTPVVIGRGWASDGWETPPDRLALDAVCPGRPVLLHSKDFHSLWVNSAALAAAGIGDTTVDPPGGRFERDDRGRATGLVREHAVRAFATLTPAPDPAREREHVRDAVRSLHAEGVTAVHDFEGPAESALLRAVCGAGDGSPLRVLMHVPHAQLDHLLATGLASGIGDSWFRLGAVKLFADGTLGSRTAAMLEPYAGENGRGMDLIPPDELQEIVRRAVTGGVSVAVHAIGDRAVRHTLDAFAAAPADRVASLALPLRIEHAQLVQPDDLPRFAALGVVASMQPSHCVSDRPLVRRYWPRWLDHAYPWAELARTGAHLAFGSDAPVEPPSVALGLHAALTRRAPGDPAGEALSPRQRVDLGQALAAYTRVPAFLAGDPVLGRFDRGAGGDLVVWDRDLFATPPDELNRAHPAWTIVDGRVVHERAAAVEAA